VHVQEVALRGASDAVVLRDAMNEVRVAAALQTAAE
jgi:hypothetical protein